MLGEERGQPGRRPGVALGGRALKDFVTKGGTIVALSSASEYVIDELALPARNAVARGSDFAVAGSLLRANVATAHPVAYGLPPQVALLNALYWSTAK